MHVATGRVCVARDACDFCHFGHKRASWLDKRRRQTFQSTSKVDFLLIALQALKQKAADAGLSGSGTDALFSVRELELESEDPSSANLVFPPWASRHLRKSSFATVAGWAAQKCSEAGRAKAQEALEVLRRHAAEGQVWATTHR